MSATTTLAFARLSAIGAIKVNMSSSDPLFERANMLLAMAAEQVLSYINLTDDDIADLSDQLRGVVATVVAEMASSRLQYNAAQSTDGYIPEGLMSSLMAPRHRRALDMAFRSTVGSSAVSILVTRDEDSSYLSPYTSTVTDLGL